MALQQLPAPETPAMALAGRRRGECLRQQDRRCRLPCYCCTGRAAGLPISDTQLQGSAFAVSLLRVCEIGNLLYTRQRLLVVAAVWARGRLSISLSMCKLHEIIVDNVPSKTLVDFTRNSKSKPFPGKAGQQQALRWYRRIDHKTHTHTHTPIKFNLQHLPGCIVSYVNPLLFHAHQPGSKCLN